MSDISRTSGPFFEATSTVYAVATTRLSGDHAAAQMLIAGHLQEAMKAGASLPEAWSMLFGAAIVALTDELEARAGEDRKLPMAVLSQSAMRHAAGQDRS